MFFKQWLTRDVTFMLRTLDLFSLLATSFGDA